MNADRDLLHHIASRSLLMPLLADLRCTGEVQLKRWSYVVLNSCLPT